MITRLLGLTHAVAYRRARSHSSLLWWGVAVLALLVARHEGLGEERETIRLKPGERMRVEVARPPSD